MYTCDKCNSKDVVECVIKDCRIRAKSNIWGSGSSISIYVCKNCGNIIHMKANNPEKL